MVFTLSLTFLLILSSPPNINLSSNPTPCGQERSGITGGLDMAEAAALLCEEWAGCNQDEQREVRLLVRIPGQCPKAGAYPSDGQMLPYPHSGKVDES